MDLQPQPAVAGENSVPVPYQWQLVSKRSTVLQHPYKLRDPTATFLPGEAVALVASEHTMLADKLVSGNALTCPIAVVSDDYFHAANAPTDGSPTLFG
jgi:hypothetical protein